MPPAGFESTISAGQRPQTHVLVRVTTGFNTATAASTTTSTTTTTTTTTTK